MMISQKLNPRAFGSVRLRITYVILAAVVCGLTVLPTPAQAQTGFTRTGSTGAQFLKIGVGARYLAMGEAAVASNGDAFSLYWNPAALGEIEGNQLALARTNWVLDITLNYAAYARRIEGVGVVAFGIMSMNVPEQEMTTVLLQNGTGLFFDANSYALTAGFARELTNKFTFGASFKYINESIANERATGFGIDMGTILHTGLRSLRLGMNISNLGGDMRFSGPNLTTQLQVGNNTNDVLIAVEESSLPLIFRVGMAYDLQVTASQKLTLATELKHPNDNVEQGSFGLEYGFSERFFLRSGYKINYDEEDITFGAGLQTPFGEESHLSLDYAFVDLGRLSPTHRFSLNISF